MIFTPTSIPGAYVIDIESKVDSRGFFARIQCVDEFAEHGLSFCPVQASISWNTRRGTLRGLHYQAGASAEKKLVRCTMGAIHDVLLDMRPGSAACGRWVAMELSAENRRSLFIPEGVANGFQTLAKGTEVHYQMSTRYAPDTARGVRWNDPAVGIQWPLPDIAFLSESDRALPDLATALDQQ
jgi:dTDP-4-dehydrorhamnose 3,5-epimerase